ncbi:MAG: acyl-CoA dehydrogenase family protein [Actinomycetes bacterium]
MTSPSRFPLDPPPEVAADPRVVAAQELAQTLLAPHAAEVDRDGVPRSHLAALAAAGLVGLAAPAELGGSGAPPAVVRAVTEAVSGADGATWFVLTQHGMPLSVVLGSDNSRLRERLLPGMASGTTLSGVAVSHLRRPVPAGAVPPVLACRVEGGWRVSGTVGWMTSWGIADVFLLGAATDDGRIVLAMLPAHDTEGLRSDGPMALAAMEGAATTRLHLEDLWVPDEAVADVVEAEPWLAVDRAKTANVTPAVFGLLATATRGILAWAERTGSSEGRDLAWAMAGEGAAVRAAAYRLIDDVPAEEQVDSRLALRAHALELLNRAAAAHVAVGAGASMSASHPAQRVAREALFHLVQAQTAPVREALVARYAAVGDASPGGGA